jgi:hypothetical protein
LLSRSILATGKLIYSDSRAHFERRVSLASAQPIAPALLYS